MADDAKLKDAFAHHVVKPGQKEFKFTLPARQPYEAKATSKQKDLLWRMGVKDQAGLDSLGKWQASAMIDQMKSQMGTGLGGSTGDKTVFIILAVLIVAIFGWMLVQSGMR